MRLTPFLPSHVGVLARLRLTLASLASLAALATSMHCGGSTSTPREGPADATSAPSDALPGDATGASDGATEAAACDFSCDAGEDVALVACPGTAPSIGSACTLPEPEQCEYGGSWWLGCNLILRCTQGVWQAAPPGQGCIQQDAGGVCPATFAEASGVDAGLGRCPAPGCQYPDGYCECLVGCGGGGIEKPQIAGHWYCAAATPQCPTPRPDLGTGCGESDASCQYGTACGCGEQLFCTDGVWQGFALPPCP